jgi:hypothetical protein
MIVTLNKNSFRYIGLQSRRNITVGEFISPTKIPNDVFVLYLVRESGVGHPPGVRLAPFWGHANQSEWIHKTFDAIQAWHRWEAMGD